MLHTLLPVLLALSLHAPADLSAKIDAIAAKALAQPNVAGLSIAVARDGEVIFSKGYGKADLEFAVPTDKETMFRIGSVTKQFTAAAVMKLVEQGKLSLDDTLDKMLPDFPATSKPITLRQILTHTSGIWSYTNDDKFMSRDASLELTPTELVAFFKDHPLDFDPGTKWNYSNSAYYLLGEIVAKAAGKPYAVFVQDELFTPLGLSRTRYESNREVIANRAQGYSFEKGKLVNDKPIGADVPGAAGSLLSNAEDLVRWNTALAGGKVISAKSYELMTTPTILPGGKNTRYGFGLQVSEWETRQRVSHGGGIFGFSSMLEYFPAEKLSIAVIANCDSFDPGKVADSIARAAMDIPEFVPADLPVSADEAKRFVGEFKFDTIPLEIVFTLRDGKMYAQATKQPENRLLYQGQGVFVADFDNKVKFTFPAGEGPATTFTLTQGGDLTATRTK
ncbi:MAG: beta-lactamase family protein [Planctomycetes bacterium]|nr:beta-lactamase family protein [Planctomycetota bacterium]